MENVDDQLQYRQIMTEPAWLRDRQVAEISSSLPWMMSRPQSGQVEDPGPGSLEQE